MKWLVNGEEVELEGTADVQISALPDRLLVKSEHGTFTAVSVRKGDKAFVSYQGKVYEVERAGAARSGGKSAASGEFHAPMPGKIVEIFVTEGQQVKAGEKLLVLEAMKTQQPVVAPFDGMVRKLPVEKGQQIAEGGLLVQVIQVENELKS